MIFCREMSEGYGFSTLKMEAVCFFETSINVSHKTEICAVSTVKISDVASLFVYYVFLHDQGTC